MSTALCVTVDVEDFTDGMAVLGEHVAPRAAHPAGLGALLERLEAQSTQPKVTLFVVGDHAPSVRAELQAFAAAGHEIASHGPDHGRLPGGDVVSWLRKGRATLEDLLGAPVRGFHAPRFDVPAGRGLAGFRDDLAEAGFDYVSDTACLGPASPVRELPVLTWRGVRVGGGSYQRLFPYAVVAHAARRGPGPAVLYYHSYDFDGTVPGLRAVRSAQMARQVLGRGRIAPMVWRLTERFGEHYLRRGRSLNQAVAMPAAEFDSYFHDRASRFAAFYRSEPVARLLGRGPLFDRLRGAVDIAVTVGARRVLDVGCGSGPLFSPLAEAGVHVVGIDPAAAMVALARRTAEAYPELVEVQERGWETIEEVDAYDAAVALGVFDYVDDPGDLLTHMGRAAPHVVGSFPTPGLRTELRRVRYGARGVHVHGYGRAALEDLARGAGLLAVELRPLGRAGHLAHFARPGA